MENKTYEKKYVERYTAYLTEVVAYFNENKTLRKFSKIAKQHKITSVTKEQFFELNLHLWGNKPLTRDKVMQVLDVVTNRKTNNSNILPKDEFITFIHKNGCRSITFTEYNDWFKYALNYRGYEDEKDRIWCEDDYSFLLDLPFVKSTKEDISRFCVALLKRCSYLDEERAHQAVYERKDI